jgi:hypothetical protein
MKVVVFEDSLGWNLDIALRVSSWIEISVQALNGYCEVIKGAVEHTYYPGKSYLVQEGQHI